MRSARTSRWGAFCIVAAATFASVHTPVSAAPQVAGPGEVDLTFLNINDFHGRIDANTVKVAGTIEALRAAGGEDATLLLSAGDNIGASLFASAVQADQPTIDVLNALDMDASAVGNHEFDSGQADLLDRVIAGGTNAQWAYLGANVYDSTGTPILPEYAIFEVGGETVGVIGALTSEAPSLVSPAGIVGLTFGDPVEAVNRVAGQLTDGDPTNGEADILIAEFHEGAGNGVPEGSTIEAEIAAGGIFARIVTEVSSQVAAIFTGHTHKAYAWDGPVPGDPTRTRPIVQTGSYGERIGKVVLTVDQDTKTVVAYTGELVARTTTADATLVAAYPRVAAVKTIVDAALAEAAVIGNVPVGSVTADITTAFSGGSYVGGVYTGGSRDDRAKESALGNLIADSLVSSLSDPSRGGATIGIVNPGGMRAELLYAPDGIITYAEANAVLPFVNNLSTLTLTGAQFKTMLEQQWQRLPNGTVPSRAYLQLSVSQNVSYTYDAALPEGSRITSITIDGVPFDPTAEYRVGMFSFLAAGGDNFHILRQGTEVRDSGLIDRDAWIQFITDNSPLTPGFARRTVAVSPLPTTASIGQPLGFTVSSLDLTSLGSPANTTLAASIGGVPLGSVAVVNGAATVDLVVPPGAPTGAQTLTLVAAPTNTTVHIPLQVVDNRIVSTTTLSSNRSSQRFGGPAQATLTTAVALSDQSVAGGTVQILQDGVVIATLSLVNGTATYTLPADTPAGAHQYVAVFADTNAVAGSQSAPTTVTVTKASSVTVLLTNKIVVRKGQAGPVATAFVLLNSGATATGTVSFTVDGVVVGTAAVVNGRAVLQLPSTLGLGLHLVRAKYSGAESINGSTSNTFLVLVKR